MLPAVPAAAHAIRRPPGAGYIRAARTPENATVLTHARAHSPLRLFWPKVGRGPAWVVTTTLGGGLVGGDAIDLSVDVGEGAALLLTTQASTKVYRSSRLSRQRLTAKVADAALFVVLPDPIVAFAGASFEQRQTFELDPGANLLVLDWLISGRQSSGERWAFDRVTSRLSMTRAARQVFFDHLRLSQADEAVLDRMRRYNAFATLVAAGPRLAAWCDAILAFASNGEVVRHPGLVASAVPLHADRGVVVRVAGVDADLVGRTLREWLSPIRAELGLDPWARRF